MWSHIPLGARPPFDRNGTMEHEIIAHRVGDATIIRIPELALDAVDAGLLYPDSNPAGVAEAGRGLGSGSLDPETGLLRESIHIWLVRTPTQVILIDTATGNGKDRPGQPILHQLDEPLLERLSAAGVEARDVDLVLHTHLCEFRRSRPWIPN
jgi:glyoxylase-like metal-dependent hydrolase (beta-lactamase superfamily II)